MFEFGKSLINMNPDEQQELLKSASPAQRRTASEIGIGYGNQNRDRQRQEKRDRFHDLDRQQSVQGRQ